jgi:hypothetical protein
MKQGSVNFHIIAEFFRRIPVIPSRQPRIDHLRYAANHLEIAGEPGKYGLRSGIVRSEPPGHVQQQDAAGILLQGVIRKKVVPHDIDYCRGNDTFALLRHFRLFPQPHPSPVRMVKEYDGQQRKQADEMLPHSEFPIS